MNSQANKTYFDDINLTVSSAASTAEPYFSAVITEAHDYHEFGQLMEGRGFKGNYRYGYQGSEKDNEISGDGSSYTTQFRQLDPRLGRWMAPDPVFQPWQSPYTSMDNNPVNMVDLLGLSGKTPVKDKKVRGKLVNARKLGKFDKDRNYTDPETGKTYTWDYHGSSIVYSEIKSPSEEKEKHKEPEEKGDLCIFVALPESAPKMGKNDNSPINTLINEIPSKLARTGLKSVNWKVGHAGVILINRETGKATYTDFGRYSGSTNGNGITRTSDERSYLTPKSAKFDDDGNLTNARDIVKSVIKRNVFKEKDYGSEVLFATVGGLDFDAMSKFMSGNGAKEYGFGKGQTYCAKYACDVIKAGGGAIGSWDMEALVEEARVYIRGLNWSSPTSFAKLWKEGQRLADKGPTPKNIVNNIKTNNPGLPSGRIILK